MASHQHGGRLSKIFGSKSTEADKESASLKAAFEEAVKKENFLKAITEHNSQIETKLKVEVCLSTISETVLHILPQV